MTPGPLLLFAFVTLAMGVVVGSRLSRTWLALTVTGTVAALSAALIVLFGRGDWEWRSGFLLGGEPLHLRLDALSALFLVLLSVVGGAGGVYAREYCGSVLSNLRATRPCVVERAGVEHGARVDGAQWDCGYATPAARMQYTSGSFAGIAAGWFAWVLRPERKLRRPCGYVPAEALRLERVPETVLERSIAPVGAAIMRVSTAVRRLQHGRLQFYILYVVAGLMALGVLVLLGGAQ